MKAFVFLLLMSFNLGCVAYVERDVPTSSRYCEVEYVETNYYGEQEWHRDVVSCTRVAGYQRRYSIVHFSRSAAFSDCNTTIIVVLCTLASVRNGTATTTRRGSQSQSATRGKRWKRDS